jgi:hypothetical protein
MFDTVQMTMNLADLVADMRQTNTSSLVKRAGAGSPAMDSYYCSAICSNVLGARSTKLPSKTKTTRANSLTNRSLQEAPAPAAQAAAALSSPHTKVAAAFRQTMQILS